MGNTLVWYNKLLDRDARGKNLIYKMQHYEFFFGAELAFLDRRKYSQNTIYWSVLIIVIDAIYTVVPLYNIL